MFTDQPVTPGRLEALIGLVHVRPRLTRTQLTALLQPRSVYQDPARVQATQTLAAALALHLVVEDDHDRIRAVDAGGDTREAVVRALEREVLAKDDVEPYLARFYAFMLGSPDKRSRDQWVGDFNRTVYGETLPRNPFNTTKLSGLWRWLVYMGLGWEDPAGDFQPLPFERVRRQLPAIFAGARELEADVFMQRLAGQCPELDGGSTFVAVHRGAAGERACTPGLAAALIELHACGILRLDAPRDAAGWSIAAAEPVPDGHTLMGDRLQAVALGDVSSGDFHDA